MDNTIFRASPTKYGLREVKHLWVAVEDDDGDVILSKIERVVS
jgi:hypothetical protein